MAGYIMTIGEDETIREFEGLDYNKATKILFAKEKAMTDCIYYGTYSTRLPLNSNAKIGTRADYFGMKPQDNIYFFYNRSIYGIGEIVDIDGTCAFYNDPDDVLYEYDNPEVHPYMCLFKASPFFFRNGMDMDDVLLSNPSAFKKLRFFHNRSFIQLDDIENAALKSFIIQNNEDSLGGYDTTKHFNSSNEQTTFDELNEKFRNSYNDGKSKYALDVIKTFDEGSDVKKYPHRIKSEFFVEGLILDYVKRANRLLGYWNFMSRQYVASPDKPAEYADNMDMFGYRYVKGYEKDGIISKFVVIEIKAQAITEDSILQIMKYVDWLCKTYAHNNYSMIEAYLVGYSMEDDLLTRNEDLYTRNYIKSTKHNVSQGVEVNHSKWKELKFVNYVDIYNELKEIMNSSNSNEDGVV